MRYNVVNECITATKEVNTGLRFDVDPLNILEDNADFSDISEFLHSEAHDVQQRVSITIHEELYSFV